jgi:hypothetical protein
MKSLWLIYSGEPRVLAGFTDNDGSMTEDHCMTSGYMFLINRGAVSWHKKCQAVVSLSTTETEYIATMHAMKERLWLHSLISQIFEPITATYHTFL